MTYQFFNPAGIEKTGTIDYRQEVYKRTRILPTKYRTPIKVLYLDNDNFFPYKSYFQARVRLQNLRGKD